MSYANFFNFGKSLNNNIAYTNSPANPLTSTIMPNYNTQFNHGATARWSRTFSTESATYMKELAVGKHGARGPWNTYCEAYYLANPENYWPNLGALNTNAFVLVNTHNIPPNSVGQNLLRNSLELYCVHYPSATFNQEQYDPNIANSPIINISNSLAGNCPAIVTLPQNPDSDPLLNKVLQDPTACADVLAYIWAAVMRKLPNHIRLRREISTDSKLYKHLHNQSKYYKYWFGIIMNGLGPLCSSCGSPKIWCPPIKK